MGWHTTTCAPNPPRPPSPHPTHATRRGTLHRRRGQVGAPFRSLSNQICDKLPDRRYIIKPLRNSRPGHHRRKWPCPWTIQSNSRCVGATAPSHNFFLTAATANHTHYASQHSAQLAKKLRPERAQAMTQRRRENTYPKITGVETRVMHASERESVSHI